MNKGPTTKDAIQPQGWNETANNHIWTYFINSTTTLKLKSFCIYHIITISMTILIAYLLLGISCYFKYGMKDMMPSF